MNNKNYTCTLCNGPEYTVSQKLYEDFINYRGHCITKIIRGLYAMVPSTLYHKIIHELYGAVSRTLYHKNYTWTLWSCFEDTITKIIRGLYGAVSRTLYHKNYTWTLCNGPDYTVSQNYTWTLCNGPEYTVSQNYT